MEEKNIDLQEGIRRFDRDRVRRRLFSDDDNVEQNNIANHLSLEEEIKKDREKVRNNFFVIS